MGGEVWDEPLLASVPEALFHLALRDILDRADVDTGTLTRKVEPLTNPTIKSTAMSLAEQLIQKGRQKGRQEGEILSLRAAVLEALDTRFSSVPEGLREIIGEMKDPDQLRHLLRHAITATDLESFVQAL